MIKVLQALLLFSAVSLRAASVTYLADGERATVNNAIAAAVSNDIVVLPSTGTYNWTNGLSDITKSISIVGLGCTIADTRTAGGPMIRIYGQPNAVTRLSGIKFTNGTVATTFANNFISLNGSQTAGQDNNGSFVRVDHCDFGLIRQSFIIVPINVIGSVDNNTSLQVNQTQFSYVRHTNWEDGEYGDKSWSSAIDYASTNFLYVWRNQMTRPAGASFYSLTDGKYGARVIQIENLFHMGWSEMHGSEENVDRGFRLLIAIGNTFAVDGSPSGTGAGPFNCRSGTMILLSNATSGAWANNRIATADSYRAVHGYLGAPFYGADGTSPWDLNDTSGGVFFTGTHTGANAATTLTDSGASFSTLTGYGFAIHNITKAQQNQFSHITANTGTTITYANNIFGAKMQFDTGDTYEVRRVLVAWDAAGMGQSAVITGRPNPTPVGFDQQFGTCYSYSNVVNGVLASIVANKSFIHENVNSNFCNQIYPSHVSLTWPQNWMTPNGITPGTVTLAPLAQQDFDMTGGSGTLVAFKIYQNQSGASLNESSGLYTAGASEGTDIIHAWDTLGNYAAATITVDAESPGPTITRFDATPSVISSGQSSTLVWTTTDATSVTLDSQSVAINGSSSVSPVVTTVYTLVASNFGGSVTNTTTVTVTESPPQAGVGSGRIRRTL